jgi:hypothetical protein
MFINEYDRAKSVESLVNQLELKFLLSMSSSSLDHLKCKILLILNYNVLYSMK